MRRFARGSGTKSRRWLVGLLVPAVGIATVLIYEGTRSRPAWLLFLPIAVDCFCIPLIDACLPAAAKAGRAKTPMRSADGTDKQRADAYCRRLLLLAIVLIYVDLILFCGVMRQATLPWWAHIAAALSAGVVSGGAIVIGHELGHRHRPSDRRAARIALALVGYGHFTIQHNRGHHQLVATPEDCASARMGESLYRFALREMSGAWIRACDLERARLAKRGLGVWSLHNEILQSSVASIAIAGALLAWAGVVIIPFLLLHYATAWGSLTVMNYVEHYGLLRGKLPNGRYERPSIRHCWNSSNVLTDLILFNLAHHSDHHTHPMRPYYALRNVHGAPQLPRRVLGYSLLAMIPPLWFAVMDPLVLEWCGGDLRKANVDPRAAPRLRARYRLISSDSWLCDEAAACSQVPPEGR